MDGDVFTAEDAVLSTLEIVNLVTGQVVEGPPLPVEGEGGCAVASNGYLYWVRGDRDSGQFGAPTARVFRASGKFGRRTARWYVLGYDK